MADSEQVDLSNMVTSVDTAQSYWQMGIVWTPLVSTEQTKGRYSLMEQLMPKSAGPPPHLHDHGDELFYLLDGEMEFQFGEQTITVTKGQLVRLPTGVPHGFVVKSETARVLNFYVPAGLDLQVSMLGTPATGPTLPPEGAERPPSEKQKRAFPNRLHELATQRMAPVPDLLAELRDTHGEDHMP